MGGVHPVLEARPTSRWLCPQMLWPHFGGGSSPRPAQPLWWADHHQSAFSRCLSHTPPPCSARAWATGPSAWTRGWSHRGTTQPRSADPSEPSAKVRTPALPWRASEAGRPGRGLPVPHPVSRVSSRWTGASAGPAGGYGSHQIFKKASKKKQRGAALFLRPPRPLPAWAPLTLQAQPRPLSPHQRHHDPCPAKARGHFLSGASLSGGRVPSQGAVGGGGVTSVQASSFHAVWGFSPCPRQR